MINDSPAESTQDRESEKKALRLLYEVWTVSEEVAKRTGEEPGQIMTAVLKEKGITA